MNPLSVELVTFKDRLFRVKRKYAEGKVIPNKIDDLRLALNCTIVLRKEGMLYFCTEVEDAQIVTE